LKQGKTKEGEENFYSEIAEVKVEFMDSEVAQQRLSVYEKREVENS